MKERQHSSQRVLGAGITLLYASLLLIDCIMFLCDPLLPALPEMQCRKNGVKGIDNKAPAIRGLGSEIDITVIDFFYIYNLSPYCQLKPDGVGTWLQFDLGAP